MYQRNFRSQSETSGSINIIQLDGNITLSSSISSQESSLTGSYDSHHANATESNNCDISLGSTYLSDNESVCNENIPVITGYRPTNNSISVDEPRIKTLINIRRSNFVVQPHSLPTIASTNMRSLFPKAKNLSLDIREREVGVACVTEIWEKTESREHQYKIEELFEMDGLVYISHARKASRGGGTAIIVNSRFCKSVTFDTLHNDYTHHCFSGKS